MKDILWFLGIMTILWLMWFFTGGPDQEVRSGFFLEPPTNISSTQSSLAHEGDEIFIGNVSGATAHDPQKEYVEIFASRANKGSVDITGWTLKNSHGVAANIPRADELPYSGMVNNASDILLAPGERVILSTGSSPIGVSFQSNICSAYLEQFQEFTPSFVKNCPAAEYDAEKENLSDECLSYVAHIPRCEIYMEASPRDLSQSCVNYLHEKINYNSCVDEHQYDSDFYAEEWRVFLGKNTELWGNSGDTIRLYDATGKLVDSVVYY